MMHILATMMMIISGLFAAQTEGVPLPCTQRPTLVENLWSLEFCLERVWLEPSADALGYSALAVGEDGTLYAARPLGGEVVALTDSDADGLPDSLRVILTGLTMPNGLAFADSALYISAAPYLYRWREGVLTTLAEDLPSGAGFWVGGIAVYDGGLYVAVGAECDACQPSDARRGAIWRYPLEGGVAEVVATGLRNPSSLAVLNGDLWTLDSAPDIFTGDNGDELNRVIADGDYGWPRCIADVGDCAGVVMPALRFPTHSHPVGVAAYTSAAASFAQNSLIVTLYGNDHDAYLEGYLVVLVQLDADGQATGYKLLVPSGLESLMSDRQHLHFQGSTFWPRRPLAVTVSAAGTVYVSVSGGQIFALRPR